MNTDAAQSLQFSWCRLADFSAVQWHEIIATRLAVFVVEQNCPYQEADALDAYAWHLQARANGQLAAYLRVVDPGRKSVHAGLFYAEPSIGRVLTTAAHRGQGFGQQLMVEGIAGCERLFPDQGIRISAQAYLLKFYQGLGFQTASDVYDEDGIAHYEMWRPAGTVL
jgi:ElaA protein